MEETDLNEKLHKSIMNQLSNLSSQSDTIYNGKIFSIRSYQRF